MVINLTGFQLFWLFSPSPYGSTSSIGSKTASRGTIVADGDKDRPQATQSSNSNEISPLDKRWRQPLKAGTAPPDPFVPPKGPPLPPRSAEDVLQSDLSGSRRWVPANAGRLPVGVSLLDSAYSAQVGGWIAPLTYLGAAERPAAWMNPLFRARASLIKSFHSIISIDPLYFPLSSIQRPLPFEVVRQPLV